MPGAEALAGVHKDSSAELTAGASAGAVVPLEPILFLERLRLMRTELTVNVAARAIVPVRPMLLVCRLREVKTELTFIIALPRAPVPVVQQHSLTALYDSQISGSKYLYSARERSRVTSAELPTNGRTAVSALLSKFFEFEMHQLLDLDINTIPTGPT